MAQMLINVQLYGNSLCPVTWLLSVEYQLRKDRKSKQNITWKKKLNKFRINYKIVSWKGYEIFKLYVIFFSKLLKLILSKLINCLKLINSSDK